MESITFEQLQQIIQTISNNAIEELNDTINRTDPNTARPGFITFCKDRHDCNLEGVRKFITRMQFERLLSSAEHDFLVNILRDAQRQLSKIEHGFHEAEFQIKFQNP